MKGMGERTRPEAASGASIGRNTGINEQANAAGRYTVVCTGPKEHLRKVYNVNRAYRDQLAARCRAPFWMRAIYFLNNGFVSTKQLLANVEAYMASMCEVKWSDSFANIVTTVGKNDCLDKYLAGSAYTAAFYLGLISATGYVSAPVIGDLISAHASWTEDQNYSNATRPAAAWSAASAGSKALSSPLAFNMNATTTIKGAFLVSNNTKGGTTGILYSAGLFTGGDKACSNGDTLNVSYTATM